MALGQSVGLPHRLSADPGDPPPFGGPSCFCHEPVRANLKSYEGLTRYERIERQ